MNCVTQIDFKNYKMIAQSSVPLEHIEKEGPSEKSQE